MKADLRVMQIPLKGIEREIRSLLSHPGHPISEVVDLLLTKSVQFNSSDIHFEPTSYGLRVRYRIDGMFHDIMCVPKAVQEQVISRIKVMADLHPHKREIVQEGRIPFEWNDKALDFRISIVPTVAGEKMVVRIFDPLRSTFELEELGYSPGILEKMTSMLMGLQGMVILTGPAGSGKTTTLYSCLLKVREELGHFASIVAIEDPVEYEVGEFAQMQVNRTHGLDFANGLKAVLRQDPEVIMVGEIRDEETCEVALKAALTGHLVLTTIHAGNTAEVVVRMLNMEMRPFIVASAVTGVVAQRLVRVICPDCRMPWKLEDAYEELIKESLGLEEVYTYRGRGCETCQGTGYRGRTVIGELMTIDEDMRREILSGTSTSELAALARQKGMRTVFEDGLQRVIDGITTFEEVLRVAGASHVKKTARDGDESVTSFDEVLRLANV